MVVGVCIALLLVQTIKFGCHLCCKPCPRSLDLSGNQLLASPIPFAAAVARGLQVLRITWDVGLEDWCSDMQWKLRCFPGLKVWSLFCCLPCRGALLLRC